jgi:hypothetical protein
MRVGPTITTTATGRRRRGRGRRRTKDKELDCAGFVISVVSPCKCIVTSFETYYHFLEL